jgi:hypothetical protein
MEWDSRAQCPNFNTTDRTLIIGFAFKYTVSLFVADGFLNSIFKDTTWNLSLWFDSGTLYVRTASSTWLGEVEYNFRPNRWYWVEWKIYTDNSAGTIDVRVGGKNCLSLSGIDTQYAGFNYSNSVNFRDNNGFTPYIDDLYVCDGAGSVHNDFLGNGFIKTLRPNGDNTADWATSSPSANHWENVDDDEHDGNSSYEQDANTNAKELYTYTDLSGLTTIQGLMVSTVARTNTGASETIQTVIKSNVTEVVSSNHTFSSTSFLTYYHVEEEDPDASSAWTDATVDAALFGYKYI